MSKNILNATQVSFYKRWASRDAYFTSFFILCKNKTGELVGAEYTICEDAFTDNDCHKLISDGIRRIEKNLIGEIVNKEWLMEDWYRRIVTMEERD